MYDYDKKQGKTSNTPLLAPKRREALATRVPVGPVLLPVHGPASVLATKLNYKVSNFGGYILLQV